MAPACRVEEGDGVPDLTSEVTELLQGLIRNRCVTDGSPESGGEARNADLLAAYLDP